MIRKTILLLITLALAGCGGDDEATVLARFDFSVSRRALIPGPDAGDLNQVSEDFTKSEGSGIWSLGPTARIHLHAMGRNLQIELVCSTMTELSAYGQRVAVSWNGAMIGDLALDKGWEPHNLVLEIPQKLVRPGRNELVLHPRLTATDIADETPSIADSRPLGVYLRSLQLTTQLDDDELLRWSAIRLGVSSPQP